MTKRNVHFFTVKCPHFDTSFSLYLYLCRSIYYNKVITMGKEKIILTGDRPTGRLHIGHYVGSLKRRVDLQDAGDYSKMLSLIHI